jgi:penicillin-binding protein 2
MVWQREDRFSCDIFMRKHKVMLVFFMFLFAVLFVRLFYLQIIRGNYYKNVAEAQRLYTTYEKAPRGIIYDAHGKTLVDNDYKYVILFYPFAQDDTPSEKTILELNKILNRDVRQSIDKSWRHLRGIKIAENLTIEEMFKVQEKKLTLPGITVAKEPKRVYRSGEVNAHVTGYVGEINAKELGQMRAQGYRPGDHIGRNGIEQYYDSYLKGTDGGWQLEVNARGQQVKAFRYIAPEIGASVYTTIDSDLQTAAYEEMLKTPTGRGAAVAIDTQTGAVKAFISVPGYDTNKVSSGEFKDYLKNKKLPLFNRAIGGLYAPGSTFKTVTFAAACDILNFNPSQTYLCTGKFELGDRFYLCANRSGHGTVNLISALAVSCNVYFYNIALELGVRNIERFARKFYLGEPTGIDLPGEKKGFVPTPEWKKQKMKMKWLSGDTLIFAIGQGALWVTPLQMAALTSAIANRGVYRKPYIVDKVLDFHGNIEYEHKPEYKNSIELENRTWDLLRKGMIEAVEHGTARRTQFKNLRVAAKTGTAQNPHGEDHAWVIAYAPADDPRLAVAVIVENGGGGGTVAVPVARKIFESYFNLGEDYEFAQ